MAGACGVSFTPQGTIGAAQTAGDCQRVVCDGAGKLVSVADDTDLPSDDNGCTDDVCSKGAPKHLPSVARNPCGMDQICDGATHCVTCLVTADCAAGICVSNTCVADPCTNQVQDPNESGIDCGGSCGACPSVAATTPADAAVNVDTAATIVVTFTTPMAVATLTAQLGSGPCTGTVQVSTDNFATCIGMHAPATTAKETVATFVPAPQLSNGARYVVKVTAAARDKKGNASPAYTMASGFLTAALLADGLCAAATPSCSATLNESGVPEEADYCVVQYPVSLTVQAGAVTDTVYGRLFEKDVTAAAGASGWIAQLGYGPVTANPENQAGWTWVNATYNTQIDNNDEYLGMLTAPAAGTYFYAYRFSPDGENWTYCDVNGAGDNDGLSFEVTQLPVLTVTP